MNREDIIRMAQEAGMEFRENADEFNTAYCDGVHRDELERFAALVAAAEREEIAQFLESTNLSQLPDATALHYARLLKGFAEGIRARGQS